MARAPNENAIKAYELYKKGYKLIDISKEIGVPEGTIRSWKNRQQWDSTEGATLRKNKKDTCNVASKKVNKSKVKKKAIADEVKEVLENDDLTDKQKLFCVIYAKCLNATKSYQKAYMCTYESAMVNGNKLLRKAKIKEQIDNLISSEFNKEFLTRSILQKYIDIAFSDVGEYLKFGQRTERLWAKTENGEYTPVIDPETGEQKENTYNYIDLKESTMVDTTLISEVSEGRDGLKFKLLDKMKALDYLTKHCNLLSDEEKIKLEIENKKLQNIKLEKEIEKISGNKNDGPIKIEFVKAGE